MVNAIIFLAAWTFHAATFTGCANHIPGTPQDTTSTPSPNIVWTVPHGKNPGDQIAYNLVIFDKKLIVGYQSSLTEEGYQVLDKFEGKTIKFIENQPSFLGTWSSQLVENKYASIYGRNFRTIDLDTYKTTTSDIGIGNVMQNFVAFGDDVYFNIAGPSSVADLSACQYMIMKNNVNKSMWEEVLIDSFPCEDDVFATYTRSFLIKKMPNEDEVIYYNAAQGNNTINTRNLRKIVAYNLTQKKFIWENYNVLDSIDGVGPDIFSPINVNGKVIFGFGSALAAYDENTGKEIWVTSISSPGQSDLKLFNGKLTILNSQGLMYLIDATTGAILKTTQLKSGNTKQWQMHNGVIYFTVAAHTLYAIDADTHEIKWEAKSPNTNCGYCTFGFASPVVDAETNRLYMSDRKEIICYELPW